MPARTSDSTISSADPRALALSRGFVVLATLTYGLIVIGALVRAHGAGLACPDWPLCFGGWVPELDIKVGFEWGHRAIAGTLTLAFLTLSALCFARPAVRPRVLPLIVLTGAVLAVQIVLGGLTVLQMLAAWTVTSHLIAGNAFALCLVLIAIRLREVSGQATRPARQAVAWPQRAVLAGCAALLLLQMVLGGLVSSTYAGLACPDWPTCAEGAFFPSFSGAQGLHLLHRITAYALLASLVGAVFALRSDPPLYRFARVALAICLLQVGVGVANVLLRIPVEITGTHTALAAMLVLTLGLALREAWRPAQAAPGATASD